MLTAPFALAAGAGDVEGLGLDICPYFEQYLAWEVGFLEFFLLAGTLPINARRLANCCNLTTARRRAGIKFLRRRRVQRSVRPRAGRALKNLVHL